MPPPPAGKGEGREGGREGGRTEKSTLLLDLIREVFGVSPTHTSLFLYFPPSLLSSFPPSLFLASFKEEEGNYT